nr:wiskott-Aldrich syndrome protein family member 1-like [Aegilops tauschii subsp. strangulata]
MLLREFLMLRVAPLQVRTRPLWRLGDEEDKVHLSPEALPDGELVAALRLLVGDDQEYPSSVFIPLFHRKDGAQVVAARSTFDGCGLVVPAPTGAPMEPTLVDLSSDESRGEEKEEDEEHDSEVTPEGMGETSPLSKADILHTLPNDDEAGARQEKGEPPVIPTKCSPRSLSAAGRNPPPPAANRRAPCGPSHRAPPPARQDRAGPPGPLRRLPRLLPCAPPLRRGSPPPPLFPLPAGPRRAVLALWTPTPPPPAPAPVPAASTPVGSAARTRDCPVASSFPGLPELRPPPPSPPAILGSREEP